MIDIKIIEKMILQERTQDLLDLLEGESKYTQDSTENIPKTEIEKVARGDALDHLNFRLKFGFNVDKVVEGNMVYSARENGFNNWLKIGAPGIEPCELTAYLQENPLK